MGETNEGLAPATIAVKGGNAHQPGAGVSPSIQLSSTFVHSGDPSNPDDGIYSYGRGGSPGFVELERTIAELEHGADSVVFNAGIAAAIAALAEGTEGTAVVLPYDAYYGIRARASELLPLRDIEVRLVDQTNLDDVREALAGASLFWTETPTNPLLSIADLEAIAEICAGMNIPWFCDNTFATPIAQNPLDYRRGRRNAQCDQVHRRSQRPAPWCGRGERSRPGKTIARTPGRRRNPARRVSPAGWRVVDRKRLAVRFERQCANALELAQRLHAHPAVEHVFYPGLPSHPGHEIAKKQMRGYFGAMLSFIVKGGQDAAQRAVDRCDVFVTATSLGGVESLIERRARWTAESAHPALLRCSIGIEDVDDLWSDLERALDS